jgi:hypothetical protein
LGKPLACLATDVTVLFVRDGGSGSFVLHAGITFERAVALVGALAEHVPHDAEWTAVKHDSPEATGV